MVIYILTLNTLFPTITFLHKRESVVKGDYVLVECKINQLGLFKLLNKLNTKADLQELIDYEKQEQWLNDNRLRLFNCIKTTIFTDKQEALDFLNEKC